MYFRVPTASLFVPHPTPLDYDVSSDDDAASSPFLSRSVSPSLFPLSFSISIVEKPSGQLPGQSVVGSERAEGTEGGHRRHNQMADYWTKRLEFQRHNDTHLSLFLSQLSAILTPLALAINVLLWEKCAELSSMHKSKVFKKPPFGILLENAPSRWFLWQNPNLSFVDMHFWDHRASKSFWGRIGGRDGSI